MPALSPVGCRKNEKLFKFNGANPRESRDRTEVRDDEFPAAVATDTVGDVEESA
jgi:hypothetical protein